MDIDLLCTPAYIDPLLADNDAEAVSNKCNINDNSAKQFKRTGGASSGMMMDDEDLYIMLEHNFRHR